MSNSKTETVSSTIAVFPGFYCALESLGVLIKTPFEDFSGDPVEKAMATHSSALAWKIAWTEKPGVLQSLASRRVVRD